ncbi:MAG: UPF0175 family protein [Promethearchaeota archaeon]
MSILSVRIDEEIEKKLNKVLESRKIQDKSVYIRQLLSKGLQEDLIEIFCQQFKKGKISLWKAAQTLDLSLREIMVEIESRDIYIFDEKALEIDMEFVKSD